jgi:alpha-L-fucosidase
MSKLFERLSIATALMLLATAAGPGCATPESQQTPAPVSDRLQWFRHDKFGMFIHWGPYAALGGEWNGRRVKVGENAEWIMQKLKIPVADYRERARELNPVEFDPAEWVRLAKETGMRYLIFTAKHHDGFAMYDSEVSEYNIVDWTDFGRDPVDELAQECRRQGLRFGFYYSHREDWNEPFAYGNTWDFDFDPERDLDAFEGQYLDTKAKPQLRELLTRYGEIALVWFDRGLYTQEQARDFAEIVRGLQPDCLINGRIGGYGQELLGDYQNTADNMMPPGGIEEYWETPQTLNETWGYSRFDTRWKTPPQVIRRLVEIVSKGGNYLLNVGPDGRGRIPRESVDVLTRVGDWMRANGDSIYGTTASPFGPLPWGLITVKGSTLYLHVFDWPRDGALTLTGLRNEVRSVSPLVERSRRWRFSRDGNVLNVEMPAEPPDPIDSVLVLEIDGSPEVDPIHATPDDDGAFRLDYLTAVTSGRAVKRFNRKGGFHISKWQEPADEVVWHLEVPGPDRYEMTVSYAALPDWGGQGYVVRAAGQELRGEVEPTGDWYEYRSFALGTVEFPDGGLQTLTMAPREVVPVDLMYLQGIELTPSRD